MRIRPILLALSVCCCAAQPAFQLSDDVVPRHYAVDLTIDPSQPAFSGKVEIKLELKKPTRVIWLHGKDIIPDAAHAGQTDRSFDASAEAVADEFIRVDLPVTLSGTTTLVVNYHGKLDDKSVVGPYRRKVGDDWYVFTTFTPIDARRAFPCFDDPRFKTPWAFRIHTRRDLKAFANGAEDTVVDEPGNMKMTRFVETKPLPSELVAFAVGPFDVFEGAPAGHGTPIRVITTRGLAGQAKAAAQATVDVLPRLEAYTAMPYPFGKLDHLALPEGAYGAVENPGLITYRQTALLAAPGADTPEKTRAIRSIQSHEIAHQWFGDLVTQATWKDVWLSEGFATWFSAKVMDEEQPPARKHLSAVAARERIMAAETGPRARPVRLAMNSREDTRGVYGRVVYDKGASILLMLDGWLGEDKVREGLRAYLKQHAFGNATTKDLESVLRVSSGIDPAPAMNSFLDQVGIPVIRADCKDGKVNVEPTGSWAVPVCVRGDGLPQTCAVIDARHHAIDLKRSCPAWIEMNSGGTGYYRTEWSAAQLSTLSTLMDRGLTQLSAAERLTLVYDLRAMQSTAEASALLKKLAADQEPEIAKAAADSIGNE
jgi:cytosol alanyl aminopeptidase